MTQYEVPQDWKSERWWTNRPVEERLFHLQLPRRIKPEVTGTINYPGVWEPGANYLITGADLEHSVFAAKMMHHLVSTQQVSGRWIGADEYVQMLKDSFDSNGGLPSMYSTPHLDKYIQGVFDILVLDGLGEERTTEFASHELGSLIRKRYERMKTTIVTSRLSIQDIGKRYGSRLTTVLADFDLVEVPDGEE